jgi:hypothetical protein
MPAYRGLAVVVIGVVSLTGTPASSASIHNQDATVRSLTIFEGVAKSTYRLEPGQTLNDVCANGCALSVAGVKAPASLFGVDETDEVSIHSGSLERTGKVPQNSD